MGRATNYKWITYDDRLVIEKMRKEKASQGEIALVLGYATCSIGRELRRGTRDGKIPYSADEAQKITDEIRAEQRVRHEKSFNACMQEKHLNEINELTKQLNREYETLLKNVAEVAADDKTNISAKADKIIKIVTTKTPSFQKKKRRIAYLCRKDMNKGENAVQN